ncbi:hypothetical protein A2U01_0118860, partial [Trifolium medium]|nr:hypothetical protein [Trifolium medium]
MIGGVIVGVARTSPTLLYYGESPERLERFNNKLDLFEEKVVVVIYLENTTASRLL